MEYNWNGYQGILKALNVVDLIDKVHWRHGQINHHPYLPNRMVLHKLSDLKEDGRRIIYYVPEDLKDIYESETSLVAKK